MKAPSFDHQRPCFYFSHQRWVSGFVLEEVLAKHQLPCTFVLFRTPARTQGGTAVVTYPWYPIRRAQGYLRIFFHAFVHDFFPTDIAVALDFWAVMLFMKRCIPELSLSDKTSISMWPQTGDQLIGLALLLQIFSLMTLFCKMTKTQVFKWLTKGIYWVCKLRERFIQVRMVSKVDYSILALSCFALN